MPILKKMPFALKRSANRGPEVLAWLAKNKIEASEENSIDMYEDDTKTVIEMNGAIGKSWWDNSGISSREFTTALNAAQENEKEIFVHVNSIGGSVGEGLTIYDSIEQCPLPVTVRITGYALSIASVFPLAADEVISPAHAIWMTHEASCPTDGNKRDKLKDADMLAVHDDTISGIYSKKTGKSKAYWLQKMEAETWMNGSTAVIEGLASAPKETPAATNQTSSLPAASGRDAVTSAMPTQGGQQKQTPNAQETKMKKTLVALLNKHGILNATTTKAFTENDADADIETGVAKIPTAQIQTQVVTNAGDDDTKKTLAKIIRDRITDKVTALVGTKIAKDEVNIFVEAALRDEAGTFTVLNGKPDLNAGGAAAGTHIEMGREHLAANGLCGKPSPKLNAMADLHGGDRAKIHAAIKKDYNLFLQDALRSDSVRNENTFTSTFTTNFLILEATTQASPRFASVRLFARDTKVDPMKPLSSGIYQLNTTAQDGSTAQTNATNFESGDSVISPVTCTVAQYTESFHVTNGQLNSGLRMENLVKAKLNSLGSKVSQVLGGVITAAKFPTLTPLIRSYGAFNSSDTQTILAAIAKANMKNMMLDAGYFYKLTNTPSLFQAQPFEGGGGFKQGYGFDNVALHTEWSGAGSNIHGFAGDETAIGTITGLPLIDAPNIPGGILAMANGTIPGVDMPITAYAWFNTATRTYWASFDTMFGAHELDTTIGMVIATGTPS